MRPIRALIVEDEQDWEERFVTACIEEQFKPENIQRARDKISALSKLADWEPDLVILDLGIPTSAHSGDTNRMNGRAVLLKIREINVTTGARISTLIISGQVMDELERVGYEDLPHTIGVRDKADVSGYLPKLIKRATKRAMPVYRDLKNHAPDLLPLVEAIMQENAAPEQVLEAANELANRMLRSVGESVLGSGYPIPATADELYERMEILRGRLASQNSRYLGQRSSEIWLDGLPYQHLQTIRNYWNTYKHRRRLLLTADHRCLLDPTADGEKEVFDFMEQMGRSIEAVRPAVEDLLEWYLPWHKRRKSSST